MRFIERGKKIAQEIRGTYVRTFPAAPQGKNLGAGDRGRTGDVQLGEFSIEFDVSYFVAITKSIFSATEPFSYRQ